MTVHSYPALDTPNTFVGPDTFLSSPQVPTASPGDSSLNAASTQFSSNAANLTSGTIPVSRLPSTAVLSATNLLGQQTLPSSGLVSGTTATIASCNTVGDGGGGLFAWVPSSTSVPDGGVVLVPTDRTATITNLSIATGDGSTTTFSGTLTPVGSGIVLTTLTLGGVVDLGGGILVGNGIYGTINYATGAWTLQYVQAWNSATTYSTGARVWYNGAIWSSRVGSNVGNAPPMGNDSYWVYVCRSSSAAAVPAYGQVITASFYYATQPGRWVRQYSGGVDIRWFGATTGVDIYSAWVRADYHALQNARSVYIPSNKTAGWTLATPMNVFASHVYGDSSGFGGGSANTLINFVPPVTSDLLTAITTVNNYGTQIENLSVKCNDTLPTFGPNSNIVTSGWIITAASFTGTISGPTLTVTAIASGTIAIGQSISGAGMAPCAVGNCLITALGTGTGGIGTYTISNPQTVASPITIIATNLPNYSAFKVGTVAFSCNSESMFYNCQTNNCKIGFLFPSIYGHVYLDNCLAGGFIGVYSGVDGGDYRARWCNFTGNQFCGILAGTQGCAIELFGCHFGYGPFGIFQVGGPSNFGPPISINTGWESLGEALAQTTSSNIGFSAYGSFGANMYPSILGLPTSIVPVGGTYLFQFLGTLTGFVAPQSNGVVSGSGGNGQPVLGAAYIGAINNESQYSDMQLDALVGNYTIASFPSGYNKAAVSVFNPLRAQTRYDRDFQRRTEKLILPQFAPNGNLMLNPETASNWVSNSPGTNVITVVPLSTLLTGALAGYTIPQRVYEEAGPNPNVIVITNATANPGAKISTNSFIPANLSRSISFSGWVAASTPTTVNVTIYGNPNNPYGHSQATTPNTFVPAQYLGITLASEADTALTAVSFGASSGSNYSVYLIAPMLCYDDLAPYSQYASATAQGPISFAPQAQYTVATLPTASWFSLGASAFATNGRNTGEAASGGTGCPVFVKMVGTTPTWCAVWSGIAVTS